MGGSSMRSQVGDLLAAVMALSAVFCTYGAVRAFYFGSAFLQPLSYSSDERPLNEIANAWIGRDPSQTLVGIHAFGDYMLTNVWSQLDDPWSSGVPVNYLPALLLVFRWLAYLPYVAGLWMYLAAMAICLALPMAWATRGQRWSVRTTLILGLALITGPAIASLDRGNPQGFLPILMFAFAFAVLKKRYGWAATFVVAAATIKVYPILLLLVLLAVKRYRAAALAVAAFLAVNLVALLVMSPKGLGAAPDVVAGVLQFQEGSIEKFLTYNVSFAGGLANTSMWIGWDGIAMWIATNAWVVCGAYLCLVLPLLWATRLEVWMRLVVAMLVTVAAMPIVYSYALNWSIAAAAVVVMVSLRGSGEPLPRWWLSAGLALVLAVAPVFVPGSMEAGRPVGVASLLALLSSVLLPLGMWWLVARRVPLAHPA